MASVVRSRVPAVALLHAHPLFANAPTIREHVDAFGAYSGFPVVPINVRLGMPPALPPLEFDAIVLHYSLFGSYPFQLGPEWQAYLKASRVRRIAFFQDEHQHCVQRVAAIKDLGITTIYSLLDPEWASQVYTPRTGISDIHFTLTGFVGDALLAQAHKFAKPWAERTIDVGYRGRHLSLMYGKGGQEKTDIARDFARLAAGRGLRLDLETEEGRRFYGDDWHKFVGDCRFMLGVEAGVSVFDLDGKVSAAVAAARAAQPQATLEELYATAVAPFEGQVPYRTVSPRIFEAIAFRTALVLYEGHYNGVVRPYEHYIPLKKDHSNAEEVFALMADTVGVQAMLQRAHADVIASGRYHYRAVMADFDRHLQGLGLQKPVDRRALRRAQGQLRRWAWRRRMWLLSRQLDQVDFPGRRALVAAVRRIRVLPKRS
jgi:hypothetical protein